MDFLLTKQYCETNECFILYLLKVLYQADHDQLFKFCIVEEVISFKSVKCLYTERITCHSHFSEISVKIINTPRGDLFALALTSKPPPKPSSKFPISSTSLCFPCLFPQIRRSLGNSISLFQRLQIAFTESATVKVRLLEGKRNFSPLTPPVIIIKLVADVLW